MEVRRATFEEVNKAQLELIFDWIGKLYKANDILSEKSRMDFFNVFASALLGKGLSYDFELEYNGNQYNLGSLSIFARKMAFMEDNMPEVQLKAKKEKIPIKVLWKALRENLYKPMDEALTLALRSSAEILGGGGGSYSVGDTKAKKGAKE